MICDFYTHFPKKDFYEPSKRKYYKPKNKLSKDFDKLFFNFLVIINYDIPINYNRKEEINIKYIISQNIENLKYK